MNTYKIVKIIDKYRVVVNAGANEGIILDDTLDVFVPGEPVLDPETNESLGTLDFIKVTLQVEMVFGKMCVCTNSIKITRNMFEPFAPQLTQEQLKTLNVDDSDISGGLSNYSKKIKIGDLVRESLG